MDKEKALKISEDRNFLETRTQDIESFYLEDLGLEEKISKAILYLNGIDGLPEIERVLNKLKLQKSDSLSIYDLISNHIGSDINEILEKMFELRLKNLELEKKMDYLLYYLKTGGVSLPLSKLEGMPHSKEYRQFLDLYSQNATNLKEILEFKSRLSLLLDSQRILDKKFAKKMAQIDYQIISLGRMLKNLGEAEKEEVCSLYSMKFDKIEGLVANISSWEKRLKKLRLEKNLEEGGFIHSSFRDGILKNDLFRENFSEERL